MFNFFIVGELEYTSDEEFVEKYNNEDKLYTNARITLNEFNIMFNSLISVMSLSDTHSATLYSFIQTILPANKMYESYYRFKRATTKSLINETKLCHLCNKELINQTCLNESCLSKNLSPREVIKKSIKILSSNLHKQLETILSKHYADMVKYKSN